MILDTNAAHCLELGSVEAECGSGNPPSRLQCDPLGQYALHVRPLKSVFLPLTDLIRSYQYANNPYRETQLVSLALA